MGVKINKKENVLFRMFIIGIVVLLICSWLCLILVINISNNVTSKLENEMENHLQVASQVIEDQINSTLQSVILAADNIYPKSGREITVEDVYRALDEYCNVSSSSEMAFVENDGTTHFINGQRYKATTGANLEYVKVTEPCVRVSDKYEIDGKKGGIICMAPVKVDGEIVGTVVGAKNLYGTLDEKAFSYLRTLGFLFLVNEKGLIIDEPRTTREKAALGNAENVFERINACVKQSNKNVSTTSKQLQEMKSMEYMVREYDTDVGTYYVAINHINTDDGLYLVHCYGKSVFSDTVNPIIGRSVFTCCAIILLMVFLMLLVWKTSKRSNEVIEKLAYEDPVTKGKNFYYFLEKALGIILMHREIPYLIMRFDITSFRYINEAYGHNRADELLTVVVLESKKVFSDSELLVRMNADQFALLAKNSADFLRRMTIFEDNINMRAIEMEIRCPIKIKAGIYKIRRDDTDINVMVDRANAARKSITNEMKGTQYAYYSDKIINDMRKVDKIESDMQKALFDGEFKVFLQPKWDINKDVLYGAEALVRWIRKDGSMIFPNEFIPVFEQNGFIEQLDYYMLEQVCAQISKMMKEGLTLFPISVNQSRRLWDNPRYVKNVEAILDKYDIPSKYVDLEVTETVFFGEKEKMLAIINELKQKEVLLSMDDFGSGYSSLNLLKDIPFDILKIDREFFSESITSKSSTWILKKIVEMAEGLGIHVLCEGVETEDQVVLLRDLGCQYVQGYYYSKPVSIHDFLKKYGSEIGVVDSKRGQDELSD